MHGSRRRRFVLLTAAAALGFGPGCTRQFFRDKADKDVTGVLTQKNIFPDWAIKNFYVYPPQEARFADPYRPDRPPYPPDDFAARMLSPNPQRPGKKAGAGRLDGDGYLAMLEQWDAQNRTPDADADPPPRGQQLPMPKPVNVVGVGPYQRSLPGMNRDTNPKAPLAVGSPARMANGPVVRPGPTITEVRDTGVIVAVGEVPHGNRTVPVVALIPVSQQPGYLPTIPDANALQPNGQLKKDDPIVVEPKNDGQPRPFPADPKADGPAAVIIAGDTTANYLKALPLDEVKNGYLIKMDQAVALGLVNSREFQDRREDLYLAALPVTLERFKFAGQAFLAETIIRESAGREVGGGARNNWQFGTDTRFAKLFPTGATMLVQLANQFVVDLSGRRPDTAVTDVSLTFAQPFLRGGGFAVTLEPLTITERNLLYAIRSYARFRKLFYVAVVAGGAAGGYTNNPYGLQGLSVNLGRGIGGNLTAPTVGYLPLLLQAAILDNQQKNVASLEQLLLLYQAFREGGQQSDLQVSQVEQNLLQARTQLLGNSGTGNGGGGRRGFLDQLDNYKLQLGLPLTVGLNLDNTPLRPIQEQLGRFEKVYEEVRELEQAARVYRPTEDVNLVRERLRQLLTESKLVRGTQFAKTIGPRWAAWAGLSEKEFNEKARALAEERRKLLAEKASRLAKTPPEPEPEAVTLRLAEIEAELELAGFEVAVRLYLTQPWLREKTETARASVQAAAFRDVVNALYQVIIAARNERLAGTRKQWPDLPPLDVNGVNLLDLPLDEAYTTGIQAALSYRLDLMNARGQVVDQWRQVAIQANSLQGVFDVRYDLKSTTPPASANPVAFSGDRSTSQLSINAEVPLVRRAERNNYRATLIGYQRQRRTLMSFEDNIANDVRADIRALRTIAELYRIQQRLIELGYSQVDNAQAILLAPPVPGAQNDAGSAAALTNQVLQAQQSLVNAQNTLYTIWVNYLSARMSLYLDLELMQVDERGVWYNEFHQGSDEQPPGPAPNQPGRDRDPAAPPERPQPLPGAGRGR